MALNTTNNLFDQSDVRETVTNTVESSVRFNLAYSRYIQSFDTTVHDAKGMFISADGLKLYTVEYGAGQANVREYTLSSPWDISTMVYVRILDISAKETQPHGIYFNIDLTKMYTLGYSATDTIDEYDLSTAGDISSATWLQSLNVDAHGGTAQGFYIREDGKQFFICGATRDTIAQYIMSTAWDISTGEYVSNVAYANGTGLSFSRDGNYVFIADAGNTVYRWIMSTVFDISTAVAETSLYVTPANSVRGIFFKPNGTKMYLLVDGTGVIQEYGIKRGFR